MCVCVCVCVCCAQVLADVYVHRFDEMPHSDYPKLLSVEVQDSQTFDNGQVRTRAHQGHILRT